MTRPELVRILVLNEISDDYENVDQVILRRVAQLGTKGGLTIERSDIVEALSELVKEGLAKAYLLSTTAPHVTEIEGMPALDTIESDFETYFYITPTGIDVLERSEWPFPEDEL